jgi:DNA-binding helix-hairpin-helix protein with protein kinase domain
MGALRWSHPPRVRTAASDRGTFRTHVRRRGRATLKGTATAGLGAPATTTVLRWRRGRRRNSRVVPTTTTTATCSQGRKERRKRKKKKKKKGERQDGMRESDSAASSCPQQHDTAPSGTAAECHHAATPEGHGVVVVGRASPIRGRPGRPPAPGLG